MSLDRFMHWFQKRFFCTSQQIPDNLEENIVKLPQISVPTNTATALHKLNDQLISNSVVPSIGKFVTPTVLLVRE